LPSIPVPASAVSPIVIGGVDTHKDLHVAAVVDTAGTVLGCESFSEGPPGPMRSRLTR